MVVLIEKFRQTVVRVYYILKKRKSFIIKITLLNVKNIKFITNFIKILVKYLWGVHFLKEVFQKYFSNILLYLLRIVIPRSAWLLLIKHEVGSSK